MSYIDVTGKTEDEAIRKALEQLGMDRDDVSVEILERAKSGFLGLGGTPARVRVTYGPDEATLEDVTLPTFDRPVKKEEKTERPARDGAKPKQKAKPAQPREEKKQEQKPREERRRESEEAVPPVADVEDLPLCDDENARRIAAFLSGLLTHLDSQAEIKVYEVEKSRYRVVLEGEKMGQLIGRRGETLDAIQQLTNYAVNGRSEKQRLRIHVDAENYRAKREGSLTSLANKVAAKVTKYHRSVTLEPMNAYERHVIHAALQEVPGVTTYSIGTEPNRRVVVAYDREGK